MVRWTIGMEKQCGKVDYVGMERQCGKVDYRHGEAVWPTVIRSIILQRCQQLRNGQNPSFRGYTG